MSLDAAPRGFVTMREHHRALEKIDALKDELADVKRTFMAGIDPNQLVVVADQFGLRPTTAKILVMLFNGVLVRSPPGSEASKVHVCLIRKRLEALGFDRSAIRNTWGVGYRMTHEARQRLLSEFPEAFQKQGATR